MSYVIIVKARNGTIAERHTDNSLARLVTYFRIRFAPEQTDRHIINYVTRKYGTLPSYSHSYNGGMATISWEKRDIPDHTYEG